MKPRFFCAFCDTEVPVDQERCPRCGRLFTSVLCPRCGYDGKVDDFEGGCPKCGYLAGGPAAGAAGARGVTGRRRRSAVKKAGLPPGFYRLAGGLLLALLAVLLALLFLL